MSAATGKALSQAALLFICHASIGCFDVPIPARVANPNQRLMQLHMHRCISHISGSKFLDATHAVNNSIVTAVSHGIWSDANWSDIGSLMLACFLDYY